MIPTNPKDAFIERKLVECKRFFTGRKYTADQIHAGIMGDDVLSFLTHSLTEAWEEGHELCNLEYEAGFLDGKRKGYAAALSDIEREMPGESKYDKFAPCPYCGGEYQYRCQCRDIRDQYGTEILSILSRLRGEKNKSI